MDATVTDETLLVRHPTPGLSAWRRWWEAHGNMGDVVEPRINRVQMLF